jgi:hypothetical protein
VYRTRCHAWMSCSKNLLQIIKSMKMWACHDMRNSSLILFSLLACVDCQPEAPVECKVENRIFRECKSQARFVLCMPCMACACRYALINCLLSVCAIQAAATRKSSRSRRISRKRQNQRWDQKITWDTFQVRAAIFFSLLLR